MRRCEGLSVRVTRQSRRGTVRPVEIMVLIVGVGLAILLGASVHRWLWAQAEFLSYRSTMRDLTSAVRAMRFQALAKRRTFQLRVDASQGMFQLASIEGKASPYEVVERTIWLPKGLQISDAPTTLAIQPSGQLPSASIVVVAPSYNRFFRLTMDEKGLVQLDEESTL